MSEWYDKGYDSVDEEIERIEQGRDFILEVPRDMKDKDKVKIVFVAPKEVGLEQVPLTFRQHWMTTPKGRRPYTCVAATGKCVPCKRGNQSRFRVIWPIIFEQKRKVKDEMVTEWVPAVWMRGSECAGKIRALADEKVLYDKVHSVTRNGLDLDTVYHYVPVADVDTKKKFKGQIEKLANFWDRYAPKEQDDIEAELGKVKEEGKEAEENPFDEETNEEPQY